MAKALALAGTGVDELEARGDGAGQDLEEGQLAVLRVVQALEDEGHGAVVVRGDVELLTVDQRNAAKVGHRREPGNDGVEQGDDALLLNAGAREDRHEDAVLDGGAQQALELLLGDFFALEVLHHDFVVSLGHEVNQRVVRVLGGIGELGGDVLLDDLAVLQMTSLHVHAVDDAREGLAGAHGDGDGAQAVAEALAQHVHAGVKVGLGLVEAVHEDRAGERQVLGGIPQAGGRGLRAVGGVNHEQGRLGGGHGRVGVAHEVGVARGIQNVDAGVLPGDRSHRQADGEAAGALLAIVVKRGLGACVATQTAGLAGQVKHSLREHGLAHACLADKRNVLNCFFCHGSSYDRVTRYARNRRTRLIVSLEQGGRNHLSGSVHPSTADVMPRAGLPMWVCPYWGIPR